MRTLILTAVLLALPVTAGAYCDPTLPGYESCAAAESRERIRRMDEESQRRHEAEMASQAEDRRLDALEQRVRRLECEAEGNSFACF
jgi:hypothetical protein